MGKRNRQRRRDGVAAPDAPGAPNTDYAGLDGELLTLRGSLTPSTRRRYSETLTGGLHREDAAQRALELLFEHLAVAWTIAGVRSDRAQELLGRYRAASGAERAFVRESLRAHLAENFPELEAP